MLCSSHAWLPLWCHVSLTTIPYLVLLRVCRLCATADAERSETAAVKKCLIAANEQLSNACRRELGRSVHMSFFIWQPNAVLTQPCDADIQKYCLKKDSNMDKTPGAVSSCLASIVRAACLSAIGVSWG